MGKRMIFGFVVTAAISVIALPALAQDDASAKRIHLPALLQLLHQADANGNGEITFEELTAKYQKATQEMFDRLDRNNDKVLSKADLPQHGLRGRLSRLQEQLRAADTNGDGNVTYEEASAAIPRMTHRIFNRLDRNNDGVISAADRRNADDDSADEE